MRWERWKLVDARTGRRCSVVSYPTQEYAERAIADVRRRVENGKRPDLADLIDHIEARQSATKATP